jgi:hypothetical protein
MKNELLLEAVNLSIEVWEYLYTHSEIKFKEALPKKLYNEIKDMTGRCPLCDYYTVTEVYPDYCINCPLGYCLEMGSPYKKWFHSTTKKLRAKYAGRIVDILCQWKKDNGYN